MSNTATMTEAVVSTPVIDDNRDMQVVDTPKMTGISFLDVMLIGADESNQAFGSWSEGEDRCALGAAALGARKLGLF